MYVSKFHLVLDTIVACLLFGLVCYRLYEKFKLQALLNWISELRKILQAMEKDLDDGQLVIKNPETHKLMKQFLAKYKKRKYANNTSVLDNDSVETGQKPQDLY